MIQPSPDWLTRLAIIAVRLSAFACVGLDDQTKKNRAQRAYPGYPRILFEFGPDVSVISLSSAWHGPWPSIAREYCYCDDSRLHGLEAHHPALGCPLMSDCRRTVHRATDWPKMGIVPTDIPRLLASWSISSTPRSDQSRSTGSAVLSLSPILSPECARTGMQRWVFRPRW
jgi:hypothetical protein